MLPFQCAAGSIPGTDHTKPGQPLSKNNQDACIVGNNGSDLIVGVVCDGCSGGPGSKTHSEIGATIGSRLVVQAVARYGHQLVDSQGQPVTQAWHRIEKDVLSHLHVLASAMSDRDNRPGVGSYSMTITEMFLFTVVGFVITPKYTTVFHVGDGTIVVNGHNMSPVHAYAPPYLVYQLTGSRLHDDASELLHFTTQVFKTDDIDSILVGSDGLDDLVENAQNISVRLGDTIGGLDQFWTNDKFFNNPDAVRRRLALINQEYVRDGSIHYGPLHDDTTLVVVRRERDDAQPLDRSGAEPG